MIFKQTISLGQIVDGSSQTIMVGEDPEAINAMWISGHNIFDQSAPVNAHPPTEYGEELTSQHPGGVNTFFGDGSVHFPYFAADNLVTLSSVPEPSSVVLLASGLPGLLYLQRKRHRHSAAVICLLIVLVVSDGNARAGSYDPQVGQPGSLGIPNTSPLFQEWASSVVSITHGP